MSNRIKYINLHDQETKLRTQEQESEEEEEDDEVEEEEAISLCDLPLNSNEEESHPLSPKPLRSSSQPSDFFEFFNDSTSEEPYSMSHAEDIILCGKLVPFVLKQPSNNPFEFDHRFIKSMSEEDEDESSSSSISLPRRYCESLPETNVVSRSNSMNNNSSTPNNNTQLMMRSSRSLDYDKLRRNSSLVMKSEVSDIRRSFPNKGSSMRKKVDDQYVLKGSKNYYKPSWYVLMFGGLVKVNQPELDVRDMKLRRSRRNMSTMFPGIVVGDGNIPATNRRSFWGHDLLKVLSCKSHSSVAFMEPSSVP